MADNDHFELTWVQQLIERDGAHDLRLRTFTLTNVELGHSDIIKVSSVSTKGMFKHKTLRRCKGKGIKNSTCRKETNQVDPGLYHPRCSSPASQATLRRPCLMLCKQKYITKYLSYITHTLYYRVISLAWLLFSAELSVWSSDGTYHKFPCYDLWPCNDITVQVPSPAKGSQVSNGFLGSWWL